MMARDSRGCQRWRRGRPDGIVRAAAVGGGRQGSARAPRTGRDRARCGAAALRHPGSPAGRATRGSPRRSTDAAPSAP